MLLIARQFHGTRRRLEMNDYYYYESDIREINIMSLSCSLPSDDKYQPASYETEYRVVMRLTIKSVAMSDFGAYRCVAKNSLGDTDGVIKLYRK